MANVENDIRVPAQETVPGGKENFNATLTSSGSGASQYWTTTSGLPTGISRLSFHPGTWGSTAPDQANRNRFLVTIPLAGFVDSEAPDLIEVGGSNYSLHYFETDAGMAVYRSSVIPAGADRISAEAAKSYNIRKLDGSWYGEVGESKVIRTLDKEQIAKIASQVIAVHEVPSNPSVGTTIRPISDITVKGGAVIKAGEPTGSLRGEFTGYFNSTLQTDGQTVGSINPADPKFLGLGSYHTARGVAPAFQNKTVFARGASFTPAKVFINSVEYGVVNILAGDWYKLQLNSADVDGSLIVNGQEYFVNAETSGGVAIYPDQILLQGRLYVWTGIRWLATEFGRTDAEINALALAQINLVRPVKQVFLTKTAFDALAVKAANTIYNIIPSG